MVGVFNNSNHAYGWRWKYGNRCPIGFRRLVVKTDIAARHRRIKESARAAHPFNGFDKLPVHFRIVGIAKIEAVGDCTGRASAACDVSGRLRDSNCRSHFRVHFDVARIAVNGQGKCFFRSSNAYNSCIRWTVRATIQGPYHAVILLPHPSLRCDIGQFNQLFRDALGFFQSRDWHRGCVPRLCISEPSWL